MYLITFAFVACQSYNYKYSYYYTIVTFIIETSLGLPFDFESQYFDISMIGAFHLGNEGALVLFSILMNFNERCY